MTYIVIGSPRLSGHAARYIVCHGTRDEALTAYWKIHVRGGAADECEVYEAVSLEHVVISSTQTMVVESAQAEKRRDDICTECKHLRGDHEPAGCSAHRQNNELCGCTRPRLGTGYTRK